MSGIRLNIKLRMGQPEKHNFVNCIAFVLTIAYNIDVRKYAFERSAYYGSKISKFIRKNRAGC